MITEEIKTEEASVRKTCPRCHSRIRVKPSRTTCQNCGGVYGVSYQGKTEGKKSKPKEVKSPVSKKSKDVKIDKSKRTEAGDGAAQRRSAGVGEGKVSERKVKEIPPDVLGKHFFIQSKRGAKAEAIITKDGIQVLKGSSTAPDWATSTPEAVKQMGKELREDEMVIVDNKFVGDYPFKSPSMAAAIVQGRSANGLRDWKNKDGKSLKEVMKEV